MKRLIYLATLMLCIAGCKDEVNIENLNNQVKLVVYCMPTASDTTYIYVSKSVPVRSYKDSVKVEWVDNARISYTVNGENRHAEHIGEGYYRVVSRQKTGDNISLRVSAEGMNDVSSSVTIPEPVPIGNINVKEVTVYDSYNTRRNIYAQVSATFTDDPKTRCHYAVRVRLKHYQGYAREYNRDGTRSASYDTYATYLELKDPGYYDFSEVHLTDSAYSYPEIHTENEELLMPPTLLDEDFGFSNDFFGNFCIFDDASINGKTHTLHLNIDPYSTYKHYNKHNGSFKDYNFAKAYQVELIRITPDYYRFLRALNDLDNNELAKSGFSQIKPMQSNIAGGLGLMGGWNKSVTGWTPME